MPQDLIRTETVAVMVRVALDLRCNDGSRRIPGMEPIDCLGLAIDDPAAQAIVLEIVSNLDPDEPCNRVTNLILNTG